MKKRAVLLSLALAVSPLSGCGLFGGELLGKGAISGLIYSNAQGASLADAQIKVLSADKKLLATGKTNKNGQFLIADVPAGTVTVVISTAGGNAEASVEIENGRVTAVTPINIGSQAGSGAALTVTGKVVDEGGGTVSGALITDVTEGAGVSTTSAGDGTFSLILSTLDKPRTLEVSKNGIAATTSVNSSKTTDVTLLLVANSRSITGKVTDETFSDKGLEGAEIKVVGSSISATTNANGEFSLRGVPFTQVSIEASGLEGYSKKTLLIAAGRENLADQNLALDPFGNLRVNLMSENNFITRCYPGGSAAGVGGCGAGLVSAEDNALAIKSAIEGFISIEGTNLNRAISYPPAPAISVLDASGDPIGTVYGGNRVITHTFEGVPGGKRSISVALTGSPVQKGISVVVPALDTIATELIVVKSANSHTTLGDITGKVIGVNTNDLGNVRVNFVTEGQSLGTTTTIDALLATGVTVASDGSYRLFNVPTGTRLVVAGVDAGGGNFTGSTYIPNTVTVINVVEGKANGAPDIKLDSR